MEPMLYQSSGRLGSALVLLPPVAVSAALLFGGAHGYAAFLAPNNPFALVTGLFTMIFMAMFLAGLLRQTAYLAKCRNPRLIRRVGNATGILAVYVSWCFYLLLTREGTDGFSLSTLFQLAADPISLIKQVTQVGFQPTVWRIVSESEPPSWLGLVVWAVEAEVIIWLTGRNAPPAEALFCESCNAWSSHRHSRHFAMDEEDPELVTRMEQGDLSVLKTLAPIDQPDHLDTYRLEVEYCGNCMKVGNYTFFSQFHGNLHEGESVDVEVISPCYQIEGAAVAELITAE